MNIKRSTVVLLGALTAVIVFLNFNLAIYRAHFFGLFYNFSSYISSPKSVLSSAVLIGGATYIVLAFLRLRNGNIPFVMIALPLLSVLLYRFVFEYNTLGMILPFVTMVIQFILGIIPTILWVIVNWGLRLLPFPSMIYTALSLATAVISLWEQPFFSTGKQNIKERPSLRLKPKPEGENTNILPPTQKSLRNRNTPCINRILMVSPLQVQTMLRQMEPTRQSQVRRTARPRATI